MLAIFMDMLETDEKKDKFIQLYEKYKNLMFTVAYKILKNESLAEETVHDVFLKIINMVDKIDEVNCRKTCNLIVLMSRNLAINVYKRNKHILPFDLEVIENMSISDEYSLDDEPPIIKMMSTLPDIYRDALSLIYIHEYTVKECVVMLGISESAFRKRLERAKNMMKIKLNEEDAADAVKY